MALSAVLLDTPGLTLPVIVAQPGLISLAVSTPHSAALLDALSDSLATNAALYDTMLTGDSAINSLTLTLGLAHTLSILDEPTE